MEEFAPAAERRQVKAWLRELREESSQSQAEIAALIGVSRETISNAEREAGSLPQGLTMIRYLRALGVVTAAPVSLPGQGLLEELRAAVAEVTQRQIGSADREQQALQLLVELGTRLQRLEERLEPGEDQADGTDGP